MEAGERDFHHPYIPYGIQIDFMSTLYDCLETGQGKSLSIICGALTWLRDHQRTELEGATTQTDHDDDEPEWVAQHARESRLKRAAVAQQDLEARLARVRADEQRKKRLYEQGEPPHKRFKGALGRGSGNEEDDAQFALDDYESDGEKPVDKLNADHNDGLSAETLRLLEKAGMVSRSSDDTDNPLEAGTKIYFCSRTHSQLAQFANEVRRVRVPAAYEPQTAEKAANAPDSATTRLISLGARKNLCINAKVSKLVNSTAINERCLELQQSKTTDGQKCQFLPNKDTGPLVTEFRDHALARVRDIEDLAKVGKEIGICPYYASRAAIPASEIVTLPYPLLLQKSAREALNISLRGHIVIVDEAHNLMDAIEGIHSSTVSLTQLQQARLQLTTYLQKFRNKLKGKNRVYVAQVLRLIDSIASYLQHKQVSSARGSLVNMAELLSGKGVDQINLHKLCRYLQESKLARKVAGYTVMAAVQAQERGGQEQITKIAETPTLMIIESFLFALTNLSAEGQFFYEQVDTDYVLKYMLLDPAHHFREVVEDARAVVLAGGTMSPIDDYVNHLFPYLPSDKIKKLSCGHVIPKENLLVCPLPGTANTSFEFTFDKRNNPLLLNELGRTLLSLASVIPDGLVVFFPSHQYLDQVVSAWDRTSPGTPRSVMDRIQAVKPVFRESKTANIEKLLTDYGSAIAAGKGGLLLSVIGGKLSEGINFSDALGRGVVVVGLPFPNAQSVEWKTKLEYVERTRVARGGSAAEGKAASREFYENACMRAVNQSVGRAIRHKGDYAAIVLLDRRYTTPRIQAKLPDWIKNGLVAGVRGDGGDRDTTRRVEHFFMSHQ